MGEPAISEISPQESNKVSFEKNTIGSARAAIKFSFEPKYDAHDFGKEVADKIYNASVDDLYVNINWQNLEGNVYLNHPINHLRTDIKNIEEFKEFTIFSQKILLIRHSNLRNSTYSIKDFHQNFEYLDQNSEMIFYKKNMTEPLKKDEITLFKVNKSEISKEFGGLHHLLLSGDIRTLKIPSKNQSIEEIANKIVKNYFPFN